MKLPLSSFVASFALAGAQDAASKHVASHGSTFEKQVFEGRDHAAAAASDHIVVDILASHPQLTSSSKIKACESNGELLGQCLRTNLANDVEIFNCGMCFKNTLPAGNATCDTLRENDWCGALNKCGVENCKPQCASEFVDSANCILAVNNCTGYTCPTQPNAPTRRSKNRLAPGPEKRVVPTPGNGIAPAPATPPAAAPGSPAVVPATPYGGESSASQVGASGLVVAVIALGVGIAQLL